MDLKSLTSGQKRVLKGLRDGASVWYYSNFQTVWITTSNIQQVRRTTTDKLEELGLIEIDEKHSLYRESGGSDIQYKLTEKGLDIAQQLR